MHVKVLITHPAPLILIRCNSATTHGRGYTVTGPWEMQGFCSSSCFLPLTRTPRSEMRFHRPRLYSFFSCKRAALQVTGLCVHPPTQAQGMVGVPETSAPLQPPGCACSALEVWGGKTWVRTLQSTLASYLFPLFTRRFLSTSQHSWFFDVQQSVPGQNGLLRTSEKNYLFVYGLLWEIRTEWHKTIK